MKLKLIAIPIVILFFVFVLVDKDEEVVVVKKSEVTAEVVLDEENEVADDTKAEDVASDRRDYHDDAIAVSFDTQTVYDESVTSDIFGDYDMTVMNIWATWCGPCVNEMPDLQEVYENLPENVNFISLCTDGVGSNETARTILGESGATFLSLLPDEQLTSGLLPVIQAYPTTVFIDRWGYAFTAISGAPPTDVAEIYLQTIDDVLIELLAMS